MTSQVHRQAITLSIPAAHDRVVAAVEALSWAKFDQNVDNVHVLPKAKRRRRPTLASVARQAKKAGIEVARYEVDPDTGKISVVPGKPEIAITEDIEIKTAEQLRRLI
jgi:hypothetical protein